MLFIHEICSIPLETVTQRTLTWFQGGFIVFHVKKKMDVQRIFSHTVIGAVLKGCYDTLYLQR